MKAPAMEIDTYVYAYYHIPKSKFDYMGIGRYVSLAPGTLQMIFGKE